MNAAGSGDSAAALKRLQDHLALVLADMAAHDLALPIDPHTTALAASSKGRLIRCTVLGSWQR
jgi:hypothetical protein